MIELIRSLEFDNSLHCLAVTNTGLIISGSRKGSITIHDFKKNEILHSFPSKHRYLKSLTVSSDNRRLISGGQKMLKVWNLENGSLEKEIETYSDDTNILITTPTDLCISGHEDGGLFIWDFIKGNKIKSLDRIEIRIFSQMLADPDGITAATLSRDGNILITGTYYGFINIWDMVNFKHIHTFPVHKAWITGIVLLPQQERGISISFDGAVKIWSLDKSNWAETIIKDKYPFYAISPLPRGNRIALGNENGVLSILDIKRQLIKKNINAHKGCINVAAQFNNNRLITASEDQTLKIWDL